MYSIPRPSPIGAPHQTSTAPREFRENAKFRNEEKSAKILQHYRLKKQCRWLSNFMLNQKLVELEPQLAKSANKTQKMTVRSRDRSYLEFYWLPRLSAVIADCAVPLISANSTKHKEKVKNAPICGRAAPPQHLWQPKALKLVLKHGLMVHCRTGQSALPQNLNLLVRRNARRFGDNIRPPASSSRRHYLPQHSWRLTIAF